MSHSRELNTKINNLHYRALRIIYRDEMSMSEELLKNDGALTIHQKSIHYLVTEMYKVKNDLEPCFMKDIFTPKDLIEIKGGANNTRNKTSCYNFHNPTSSTGGGGGGGVLKHLGRRLWKMVPEYIKEVSSLEKYKSLMKLWGTTDCPYKLCKIWESNRIYIEAISK